MTQDGKVSAKWRAEGANDDKEVPCRAVPAGVARKGGGFSSTKLLDNL